MKPELCHDISADATLWKNINAFTEPNKSKPAPKCSSRS